MRPDRTTAAGVGAGAVTAAATAKTFDGIPPDHLELDAQARDLPREPRTGTVFRIDGLGRGEIAYNPSAPFSVHAPALGHDVTAMYVRVESRDSAVVNRLVTPPGRYDPRSVLYVEAGDGHWTPADARTLGLPADSIVRHGWEDPFVCRIGDDLVVGAVVIDFSTAVMVDEPIAMTDPSRFDYTLATPTVTVELHRGPSITALEHVATIKGMREVRLAELSDGSVLVATRPQGGAAGLGMIGLTRIQTLNDLTQDVADGATLIDDLVAPEIKVGPNDMELLAGDDPRDDRVAMLAHTAYRAPDGNLHYYAGAFTILNPHTCDVEGVRHTGMRVIAARSDWRRGRVKRPTLDNVVFPSTLTRRGGDTVLLGGLSDGDIGEVRVPEPFR